MTTKHRTGRPNGAKPALEKALAWFRQNGPDSPLSTCAESTGVSLSTAQTARRVLKANGELPQVFSPKDHGAGELPEISALPSSSAPGEPGPNPPLRARTLNEIIKDNRQTTAQDLMDAALERVLEGAVEVLTSEQAMQLASELVRIAPTFPMKVTALREFNRLRATAVGQEQLGPGKPLTVEDRRRRAANILKACGEVEARAVWSAAFGQTIVEVHDMEVTTEPSGAA